MDRVAKRLGAGRGERRAERAGDRGERAEQEGKAVGPGGGRESKAGNDLVRVREAIRYGKVDDSLDAARSDALTRVLRGHIGTLLTYAVVRRAELSQESQEWLDISELITHARDLVAEE